jgi:hypothetical protein
MPARTAYANRMSDLAPALDALLRLPGIAAGVESAREACTALRWHEALRRRIPEAAAESRIRGAQASAQLDGAQLPLGVIRDLVRGAQPWPAHLDPVDGVVRGAVQATAETEFLRSLVVQTPAQALARLHIAAVGGAAGGAVGLGGGDSVGRPRVADEVCREFVDLGPAPEGEALTARIAGILDLVSAAGSAPVALVGALVHAEVCVVRPFVRGNGLVARALERAIVHGAGLDPTGVSVPEAGYLAAGDTAYLGALTAYATGRADGVALWLRQACDAYVEGARQGRSIADSVLAGRLV